MVEVPDAGGQIMRKVEEQHSLVVLDRDDALPSANAFAALNDDYTAGAVKAVRATQEDIDAYAADGRSSGGRKGG